MLGLTVCIWAHILGTSELGGVCDFLCFLLECIFLFWSVPLDQNKRLDKLQLALTHEDWEMQCPSSYLDGLVTSGSCNLLVAAALALQGFSPSSTASLERQ